MTALITGALALDGDCLYVASNGMRIPVLWPYGTRWDREATSVVLADGRMISVGEQVDGGGGYIHVGNIGTFTSSSVSQRAEHCAEDPYFEIAVLQSI